MKLGGKISRSLRYVIAIIGTDPLYLGVGLILKKNDVFLTYEGVIGSS